MSVINEPRRDFGSDIKPGHDQIQYVKADLNHSQLNKTTDSQNYHNATNISPEKQDGPQVRVEEQQPDPVARQLFNVGAKASGCLGGSSNHQTIMRDGIVKNSFTQTERCYNCLKDCVLRRQGLTYVDQIKNTKGAEKDKFVKVDTQDVTKITVLETAQLELDPNVMHPFVKLHLVDINNGQYIKKSVYKDVINANENITYFDGSSLKAKGADFIPPFATNSCDLNEIQQSRPQWNHEIVLDESCSYLFSENVVLLAEILDYNYDLLRRNPNSKKLDNNMNYRIAWGFLKLNGLAKNHTGLSKIQLYQYKFHPTLASFKYIMDHYKRVPAVYYDFIYRNKEKYDCYLSIQVNANKPIKPYETHNVPENIFAIERDEQSNFMVMQKKEKDNRTLIDDGDKENEKLRRELMKIRRLADNDCRLPDQIYKKFYSADQGCFRLTFSPDGVYLAAACTFENSKTIIRIFNVETGKLVYNINAHKNIVHDLDFSPSGRYLVSASSDFSAKLWHIPQNEPHDLVDEDDSEELLFISDLIHGSYVYSAKFFNTGDDNKIVIATACFDSTIKIWRIDSEDGLIVRNEIAFETSIYHSYEERKGDEYETLIDHRHPNCLTFDSDGRLYAGDSLGEIHVYSLRLNFSKTELNQVCVIASKELAGDPINSIQVVAYERKKLLVHSRDNCIRVVDYHDYNKPRILDRYYGGKSTKMAIRTTQSPDGQWVLSGSEDGRVCIWDFTLLEKADVSQLGVSFHGPVTDVAWNRHYHMIAVSGFGAEYPILLFVSKKTEDENMKAMYDKIKGFQDDEEKRQVTDIIADEETIRQKRNSRHNSPDRTQIQEPTQMVYGRN